MSLHNHVAPVKDKRRAKAQRDPMIQQLSNMDLEELDAYIDSTATNITKMKQILKVLARMIVTNYQDKSQSKGLNE